MRLFRCRPAARALILDMNSVSQIARMSFIISDHQKIIVAGTCIILSHEFLAQNIVERKRGTYHRMTRRHRQLRAKLAHFKTKLLKSAMKKE